MADIRVRGVLLDLGGVMVGDDAEGDVGGALAAGIRGVLVRTGKYRNGDEDALDPPPTHVADDLAATVEWILDLRRK